MSDPMATHLEKVAHLSSAELINLYETLPPAYRLAMHFVPGGPVRDLPEGAIYDLRELMIRAFMRMPWQARADLLRRAAMALEHSAPKPAADAQRGPSELEPLPAGMMMPVDDTSPADVLRLFRAFVLKNATQWEMGAGVCHHPIWELIALHIDGPDPTQGPEYAFISPENRQRLSVLKKIAEEAGDE